MDKTILAVGADIKNRFLIAKSDRINFGPDIGDLARAKNYEFFKKEAGKAVKKFKPDVIACDPHPDYFSSLFAQELNCQLSTVDCQLIQHHHAHIASVMQEHNLKKPVIGVCFDGTGYGQDANSWGGEFLLVNRSGFKRLSHFKYRMMPGGDKVVQEPWRMVLSILGEKAADFISGVPKQDKQLLLTMLSKRINSPLTSSSGRLFDAAAALLGISVYARHEAEGPIRLEAICEENCSQRYEFETYQQNGCLIVDTDDIFSGMLKDLKKAKDNSLIASKFHNSIVQIVVQVVQKLCRKFAVYDIALSGGVWQNNFLKKKVTTRLAKLGFRVFTNVKAPVNDLNISLGQYYVSCNSGKS
ncbi:MAG: carbamoyltransferase HypF [Candidatus Omnitrophica bacterium]|nr:carbamoyltransferase HypF [Candidatus Omnitrophota bacterium]